MTYGSYRNLVNGQFVSAASGDELPVYNPATSDEKIGSVPAMSEADLKSVFEAAAAGAKTWRRANHLDRGKVLLETARIIRSQSEDLVELIVSEMGKTRAEATGEVTKTAEFFDYYGSMGRDSFGEFLPDGREGTFAARLVEPLGIVLLITPWNDPLLTPARKLGPALISGNSVVIKPASVTPMITLRLAQILHEAGLPAGVLGTVTGRGADIGDELFEMPGLKAVSFTGSTSVGKRIQDKLSPRGIRVQTEMGGKNASVIMDDADLDLALPTIMAGAFAQAGQRCTATSRLIVQKGIASRVRERLVAAVTDLRVAPGSSEGADLGPVVDQNAQKEIRAHIAGALDQGATLLAQRSLEDEAASEGSFVEPTLLAVDTSHDIWRDEVFGPVLSMIEVENLDEAIDMVNDSAYGLSSAIFTRDLAAAFRFLSEADTGQVSVNQPTTGWDIHHPFGGFKDSGSGYKEQGHDALRFYTRVKAAAIRTH
ncbi:aldehyde dehydrogenase family protein [Micrococcus terreus]|uniref:aldehyde dehydrogenase family protein n=1 Tax=Micrococcus terreus TaxID=574650 RepID=UPI00254E95F0|nr:aldehyde dehydrogenase family protein [Micrococcus terreus]MDK7701094.1 aldehyde dehydrogenase family protein [Micrococcus terreus]WOO96852.1 aldehyde dehydrogenase family protein [Micrococcus terreus]